MATAFAFTKKPRRPIAAWMVQANPAIFDVGTVLAEAEPDAEWDWTCFPSYRIDLIDRGQPVLLWVTRNDNPALTSGIWVVGESTGQAYISSGAGNVLWVDTEKSKERRPFLPWVGTTLANIISREALLQHPILRDLEVLRMPQQSNPLVVTPEQLDALERDFGLATGPLSDEVRLAIASLPPYFLWLRGPGGRPIEVDMEGDEWKVWDDGAEVDSLATFESALRAALRLVEDTPISSEADGWDPVAQFDAEDGVVAVYRTGSRSFEIWATLDGEEALYEGSSSFRTLEDALSTTGRALLADDA